MTPTWAWPVATLLARCMRRAGEALERPPSANTRAAGPAPAPGSPVPPVTHQESAAIPPVQRGPAPGLTPDEALFLASMQAIRKHAQPGQDYAAREVADSLRTRAAHVDDHTLGVITMDLLGYIKALWFGLPDAEHAVQCVMDSFALAAEELTRLERNDEVPR